MAIFKCKMCGGSLEITDNSSIAECQYCGTVQTVPRLNDDKKNNMLDRANYFLKSNEYDKAAEIYEKILNEDGSDSEVYWLLALCKYGVEYVEDPKSHKRIPTINRIQLTPFISDANYKQALNFADEDQKKIYIEEANTIDCIQKRFIDISKNEKPFDVFLCYKETDDTGKRSNDSVLATDLYYELEKSGLKVFFSRITLEDKLGQEFEPYIFSALNSSKAMVVLGTKPENFNAVWVKNEWSRYISLIKGGANKILIPAYRDMDPYDLPGEFRNLQAQDMSKLGFVQDITHCIKKHIEADKAKSKVSSKTIMIVAIISAIILSTASFVLVSINKKHNSIETQQAETALVTENTIPVVETTKEQINNTLSREEIIELYGNAKKVLLNGFLQQVMQIQNIRLILAVKAMPL